MEQKAVGMAKKKLVHLSTNFFHSGIILSKKGYISYYTLVDRLAITVM